MAKATGPKGIEGFDDGDDGGGREERRREEMRCGLERQYEERPFTHYCLGGLSKHVQQRPSKGPARTPGKVAQWEKAPVVGKAGHLLLISQIWAGIMTVTGHRRSCSGSSTCVVPDLSPFGNAATRFESAVPLSCSCSCSCSLPSPPFSRLCFIYCLALILARGQARPVVIGLSRRGQMLAIFDILVWGCLSAPR